MVKNINVINELKKKCPIYIKSAIDQNAVIFGEQFGGDVGKWIGQHSFRKQWTKDSLKHIDHFQMQLESMGYDVAKKCGNEGLPAEKCMKLFEQGVKQLAEEELTYDVPKKDVDDYIKSSMCSTAVWLLLS